MNHGGALGLSTCSTSRQDHHRMSLESLKRRVRPSLGLTVRGEASYPSPPMSNPPSPLEHTRDEGAPPATTSSEQSITVSAPTTSTSMPGVVISAPALASSFFRTPSLAAHRSPRPATESHAISIQPTLAGPHATTARQVLQPAQTTASGARPSSSKGGRKSKAHVASACVNCKKAHLSCDINRPCARCVASGKQDTCYDVQHKKRGRPRLREEGEFKVEQMLEAGRSSIMVTGTDSSIRPIASTRHRRQESFRSLRSQGSDGSGVALSPIYPHPPPPTATQATFSFHHPFAPSSGTPGYEIPTAYLDLDLVFLKSNAPFRQIMLAGQEVVGRALGDIAAPVDGESFYNIRNRIRTERDARDPAYMPPIHRPGQDLLQGASVADVERYTQGFEDHTHVWTQTQLGVAAQRFPVRVRLAKAHTYWVAISLPSFHPVGHIAAQTPPFLQIQPVATGSQTLVPESYTSSQYAVPHSTPVAGFLPHPGHAVTLQPPPRAMVQQTASRTYPGAQPPHQQPPALSFQPTGAVSTPRLPVAEPPTATTAFNPRTTARELSYPHATPGRTVVQLPPLIGSPAQGSRATTGGRSGMQPPTVVSRPIEPDEDEDADAQGRPSKRRRMGIDDVLHR